MLLVSGGFISQTACRLMWDFTVTFDLPTLVDKQHNVTKLIDVAIPGDSCIQQKAVEK